MKRVVEQELLDQDMGTPQEIDESLRSVDRVNRWFGGDSLHARLIGRAIAQMPQCQMPQSQESQSQQPQCQQPQVLEVASGRATVLRRALARLKVTAEVTLLDRSAAHLPRPCDWPRPLTPRIVHGDALALPFPDASVHIDSCCLFLHHLDPSSVARFLAEAARVARVAVVINDLERGAMHYRLAQLNSLFDPSRISRHDGPVSVRRAYTFSELHDMLTGAGQSFSLVRAPLFRLGAIVWCGEGNAINGPGML